MFVTRPNETWLPFNCFLSWHSSPVSISPLCPVGICWAVNTGILLLWPTSILWAEVSLNSCEQIRNSQGWRIDSILPVIEVKLQKFDLYALVKLDSPPESWVTLRGSLSSNDVRFNQSLRDHWSQINRASNISTLSQNLSLLSCPTHGFMFIKSRANCVRLLLLHGRALFIRLFCKL